MESVSLRLYSDAYPCHNINVESQIPLELEHLVTWGLLLHGITKSYISMVTCTTSIGTTHLDIYILSIFLLFGKFSWLMHVDFGPHEGHTYLLCMHIFFLLSHNLDE